MTKNNILTVDYLKNMDIEDILFIWNDIMESEFEGYGYVADNDVDIIENLFPTTFDGIRASFYGNYKPFDEFLKLNERGNLDSSNDLNDLIDYSLIFDYVYHNLDHYVQQGYINPNLI